ncbi:MAG: hypothetical protein BWY74_03715 [Firmicutes bacterium ADurb.Bin419]|nr:MAG: hypothetical protein BWY74_03715 [Firmicutes bacterium ADurb.Bin419]
MSSVRLSPFAISAYLSITALSSASAFPSLMHFSASAIKRSVTFISSLKRLPGADTTTRRLSGSEVTISHTFLICSAFARDVPPNFATFIITTSKIYYNIFYSSRILMVFAISTTDFDLPSASKFSECSFSENLPVTKAISFLS